MYAGLAGPTATLPVTDPFDVAVHFGLADDTDASYASYLDFARQLASASYQQRLQLIASNPELAGFLVAVSAVAAHPGVSAADLQSGNYGVQTVPESLPQAIQVRYVSALDQYIPEVVGYANDAAAQAADPAFGGGDAAAIAWANARAANDNVSIAHTDGSVTVVPRQFVTEGPVVLPDGMGYLVYVDPYTAGHKPTVLWWQTARFIPPQPIDAFLRPGECDVTAGTGPWYQIGAGGGTCPPPPPGWSQGFGLVSAVARGSLLLGSEYHATVPGASGGGVVAPVVTPAPSIVSPPTLTPVPPPQPVAVPYNGPTPVLVQPVPVPTSTPQAGPTLASGNAIAVVAVLFGLGALFGRSSAGGNH